MISMLRAASSSIAIIGILIAAAGCEQPPTSPQAASPSPAAQQQGVQDQGAPAVHGGKGELVDLPLPDPVPFTTPDGKAGWKVQIPGGRPLATPAHENGLLFLGGGFGSYEFYAIDARTGRRVWTYKCGDDGPTAAVVEDGIVAYNTESCIVYVHEARTGKLLWHKWLGDPLMSQPAVAGGKLFMAYPGSDGSHHLAAFDLRTGEPVWDQKIKSDVMSAPVADADSLYAATVDGTLYGFDLKSGSPLWSYDGKITGAPRVVGDEVYVSQRHVKVAETATGEGDEEKTVRSESTWEGFNIVDARTGRPRFPEPVSLVKASYLVGVDRFESLIALNIGQNSASQSGNRFLLLDFSGKPELKENEGLKDLLRRAAEYAGKPVDAGSKAGIADADEADALARDMERRAEILKDDSSDKARKAREQLIETSRRLRDGARKTRDAAVTAGHAESIRGAAEQESQKSSQSDASVGFAKAPEAAKLVLADTNIGVSNVHALWAYQGSQPLIIGEDCLAVSGDVIRSVRRGTFSTNWETAVKSAVTSPRPASPPAAAGGKLYTGRVDGTVACYDAATGKELWATSVGGSIAFQPMLAGGRIYVVTVEGTLTCLETGDPSVDGWYQWGATARHNGR